MKIIEDIILTKHHYAPAGAPINRYSISDKPINELIENLKKYEIDIDLRYSEKKVIYLSTREKPGGGEKEVVVPLDTKFPNEAKDAAYYLKSKGGLETHLELEVSNYDSITQMPPSGVVGGTFAGDFGIIGKLTLEGREVDMTIVQKVRKAMEATYLDNEEDSPIFLEESTNYFEIRRNR